MNTDCSADLNNGLIVGVIWGLVIGLFIGTVTLDLYINEKSYYTTQIDELQNLIDSKDDKIDNLIRQLNDLDDEVTMLTSDAGATDETDNIAEIVNDNKSDLPPRKRYRSISSEECNVA